MTLRLCVLAGLSLGWALNGVAQTDEIAVATPTLSQADVTADTANWRAVEPEDLVLMQTSKGRIVLELAPEFAPRHVAQFKTYVRAGLYDNTPFHRVIKGFMAQGGDVELVHGSEKMLQPMEAEFTIRRDPSVLTLDTGISAAEATDGFYQGMPIETQPDWLAEMSKDQKVESWIPHCPGVLSSARTGDPNSANAQFFLISESGRHLDKKYTAKGRAVAGLDIIQSIKLGPEPDGYPIANPDVVISAVMVADLSPAERPAVFVQRTDTPAWQDKLKVAAADKGTDICDLGSVPALVFD